MTNNDNVLSLASNANLNSSQSFTELYPERNPRDADLPPYGYEKSYTTTCPQNCKFTGPKKHHSFRETLPSPKIR